MTTPDTKMLSAEQRNPGGQSFGPSRYIEVDREQYAALTARVAELEQVYARAKAASEVFDAQVARINELESELAAARAPVEEKFTGDASARKDEVEGHGTQVVTDNAPSSPTKQLDVKDADLAALARELSGWTVGDKASDDARRMVFLMHKAADLITRLARERDEARDKALEEASNIVAGASVAVNYLPDLKTPNDLAGYLTRRDLKLAEEIRALKSAKGE